MKPGEIAARFGVSLQTVATWADQGLLPCIKLPSGQRRFRRSDVERFAQQRETA